MKGIMIKDIQDNQAVEGLFLVKDVTRSETKNGNPFLALTIMDASGEMAGRVWDNADQLLEQCRAGTLIRLQGQSQSYKGVLQLRVDHLEKVELPEEEMGLFIPATKGDIKAMGGEIIKLSKSIENEHYQELVLAFFNNRTIFNLFKKAPAAKAMHHACFGGLLEHTLGVARLADSISAIYPAIDRSLLMAGALLHDIGKLTEFDYETYPYNYSDRGRLVGHMVLGIEMIQEQVAKLSAFPEDAAIRLKHLILAHHGRHEFGSPALPMMLEAFVLHFLDDLDAKVNYLTGLGDKVEGDGYQWTDFQRNLERFLFVRNSGDNPGSSGDSDPDNEIDPRQKSLWK